MTTFSQRHGYTSLEKAFQRESIDITLRTKLWNILKLTVWDRYERYQRHHGDTTEQIDHLVRRLWLHYFNYDLDRKPEFYDTTWAKGSRTSIKEYFFSCEWYQVYDLIEIISKDITNLISDATREWINETLEEQNSAYRFVGTEIAEITDKNEIHGIETALATADSLVRTHLDTALRMLSDKESPDFRNSVKESISAVEAACRLISGSNSDTLANALKRVQNLHPAMSRAFTQLYGYTSDASGIRHSLTDEATITYADAKFMLVACSAFVSYLKVTANT
jgi:AbiJ N-terminal domain 4